MDEQTTWDAYLDTSATYAPADTAYETTAAETLTDAGVVAQDWSAWNEATGDAWSSYADSSLDAAISDLEGGWIGSAEYNLAQAANAYGEAGDAYATAADYSATASADLSAAAGYHDAAASSYDAAATSYDTGYSSYDAGSEY